MQAILYTITTETIDGSIELITLNRASSANALNTEMAGELRGAFENLKDTRAVIITGHGRNFCAGADLKERKGMDEKAWQKQHHAFEMMLHSILDAPIPVIAAVNGAAFGGGLEIAMACDFIYASEDARFALPEAKLGIMPGLGGTQNLPRAVGERRAREILFTGAAFASREAYDWGLVNRIYPSTELLDKAMECARMIAGNAPMSVRAIKRSVREGEALPLAKSLACELGHYNFLLNTQDRHEGINAFNEKRRAVFTGK